MRFTSTLEKFESELWGHHFPVSDTVAQKFIRGTNRRIKCKINDQVEIQCALMPNHGDWYVLANKQVRSKLGVQVGDEVTLELSVDDSEYGHAVPESFQMILDQDPEGEKVFHSLTKGKQRSLVYLVTKVKNVDRQIAKGLAIMHHMKECEGEVDFKRLNELIKHYNKLKASGFGL
jgi:hypothetical protein